MDQNLVGGASYLPPRVLLDACVLYPTVLREILIGVAATGAFTPLWSPRILEEWARAAGRLGAEGEAIARAEIALMAANWPTALVPVTKPIAEMVELPDPNDRHVLAAAIEGCADRIVTLNARDFPRRRLAVHGMGRQSPDEFLMELHAGGSGIDAVAEAVRNRTETVSGRDQPLRPLLKRAGLPRLGKALSYSELAKGPPSHGRA